MLGSFLAGPVDALTASRASTFRLAAALLLGLRDAQTVGLVEPVDFLGVGRAVQFLAAGQTNAAEKRRLFFFRHDDLALVFGRAAGGVLPCRLTSPALLHYSRPTGLVNPLPVFLGEFRERHEERGLVGVPDLRQDQTIAVDAHDLDLEPPTDKLRTETENFGGHVWPSVVLW